MAYNVKEFRGPYTPPAGAPRFPGPMPTFDPQNNTVKEMLLGQRLALDPSLGALPLMPFYTPPEEQGQDRPLPQLPPEQPRLNLTQPQMRPPAPYQAPVLDLNAPPGFGPLPATTADPMAAAEALQGQTQAPPAQPQYGGFEWVGASGRRFSLSPDEQRGLVEGRRRQIDRMSKGLSPLAGVGRDPAGAASGLMGSLSEFMDPDVAAKLGISVFDSQLNRQSAEERAQAALDARAKRGTGSGGGAPGANLKSNSAASNAQQRIFSSASSFNLAKVRAAQAKTRTAMAMANLDSGLGDEAAFRNLVNALHGAASSNKELQGLQDAAGKIDQWIEQAKGVFMKERRLPPALMQQLRGVLDETARAHQAQIDAAADFVRTRAKNDPILQGLGRADADSEWMGQAVLTGSEGSGGGGGGNDDAEAEDLLR